VPFRARLRDTSGGVVPASTCKSCRRYRPRESDESGSDAALSLTIASRSYEVRASTKGFEAWIKKALNSK